MKSINLHVGELLSPLGALGVEKQLKTLNGVTAAVVNPVSGCATVTYDEGRIAAPAIEEAIERCGHHCAGALVPKHLCDGHKPQGDKATPKTIGQAGRYEHGDHGAHGDGRPPDHHGKPAQDHVTHGGQMDAMSHEMGHGAGMDMQAMVRDMRNRFWISLVFSIPIFLYSPMGMGRQGSGLYSPPLWPDRCTDVRHRAADRLVRIGRDQGDHCNDKFPESAQGLI